MIYYDLTSNVVDKHTGALIRPMIDSSGTQSNVRHALTNSIERIVRNGFC